VQVKKISGSKWPWGCALDREKGRAFPSPRRGEDQRRKKDSLVKKEVMANSLSKKENIEEGSNA